MGYVTSLFARKMVAAAGDTIDAAAILAGLGIDPATPVDPRQMIPAARYYAMLEQLAEQIDVTDLPVRAGASMQLDEYRQLIRHQLYSKSYRALLMKLVDAHPLHYRVFSLSYVSSLLMVGDLGLFRQM